MSKRNLLGVALRALAPVLLATSISTTAAAATPTPSSTPAPTTTTATPTPTPTPTTTASTKSATQSATAGVTITRPQTGDTIVNTGLEIVGTAPPAWLVSVSIIDTALGRTEIQHQPNGRVDGSVTTDATGHWVFVPQVKIVPGSFEVSASYMSADNQVIESAGVRFVVVNESGESSLPSSMVWWKIAIAVLTLMGAGYVGYGEYRRHHGGRPPRHAHGPHLPHMPHMPHMPQHSGLDGSPASIDDSKPLFMSTTDGQAYQRNQARKMQAMEDEMNVIRRALADSAEALERSNRSISALHRQIRDELTESSPEPAVEVVSAAPKRRPAAKPAKPAARRSAAHEGPAVVAKRNGDHKTLDRQVEALEVDWALPKLNGVKTPVPDLDD